MFLVGNVIIDTLLKNKTKAEQSNVLNRLSLEGDDFAVLTLHRPSNIDDPVVFGSILDALEFIQRNMSVIFPIHPLTRRNLSLFPLARRAESMPGLRLTDPIGYLDFLKLIYSVKIVLTNSGGVTTILRIPCLTLRDNTERPVTVEMGTNQISALIL